MSVLSLQTYKSQVLTWSRYDFWTTYTSHLEMRKCIWVIVYKEPNQHQPTQRKYVTRHIYSITKFMQFLNGLHYSCTFQNIAYREQIHTPLIRNTYSRILSVSYDTLRNWQWCSTIPEKLYYGISLLLDF